MISRNELRLNDSNFVIFNSRNFRRQGDKNTWARYDASNNTLTVCKAGRGLMSDEFTAEMREFCASCGIDFDTMSCGQRVTVELEVEEPAVENVEVIEDVVLSYDVGSVWATPDTKTGRGKWSCYVGEIMSTDKGSVRVPKFYLGAFRRRPSVAELERMAGAFLG